MNENFPSFDSLKKRNAELEKEAQRLRAELEALKAESDEIIRGLKAKILARKQTPIPPRTRITLR